MAILVLIIAAFVGIYVWQFIETRHALRTDSVLTRYAPEQAVQMIESAFGGARSMLWTDTRGNGRINKRRRGFRRGITMSIDVEPLPDGGCRIDMWASEGVEYLGFLVNFAGVVNRRKRAIARLLAEPDTRQIVAANGGTSVQVNSGQGSQPGIPASSPANDQYR